MNVILLVVDSLLDITMFPKFLLVLAVYTVTLGVGGEYITGDIGIGLRLPPDVAERVKIQHGHACAARVSPEERFTVSTFGGGTPQVVPRWRLAAVASRCLA